MSRGRPIKGITIEETERVELEAMVRSRSLPSSPLSLQAMGHEQQDQGSPPARWTHLGRVPGAGVRLVSCR